MKGGEKMNFKKIVAIAAATGLMLSATAPVLANDPELTISNWAKVKNKLYTKSNTGHNSISATGDVKGGEIGSGAAFAGANLTNSVNWTELACGCVKEGDAHVLVDNSAKVKNYLTTKSNTGHNSINAGDDVEGGVITTGSADSQAIVVNDVNTTIMGGTPAL